MKYLTPGAYNVIYQVIGTLALFDLKFPFFANIPYPLKIMFAVSKPQEKCVALELD